MLQQVVYTVSAATGSVNGCVSSSKCTVALNGVVTPEHDTGIIAGGNGGSLTQGADTALLAGAEENHEGTSCSRFRGIPECEDIPSCGALTPVFATSHAHCFHRRPAANSVVYDVCSKHISGFGTNFNSVKPQHRDECTTCAI